MRRLKAEVESVLIAPVQDYRQQQMLVCEIGVQNHKRYSFWGHNAKMVSGRHGNYVDLLLISRESGFTLIPDEEQNVFGSLT